MIQMGTDGENKDKSYDEISNLLKRFYKPDKEIDPDVFLGEVLSPYLEKQIQEEEQGYKAVNYSNGI